MSFSQKKFFRCKFYKSRLCGPWFTWSSNCWRYVYVILCHVLILTSDEPTIDDPMFSPLSLPSPSYFPDDSDEISIIGPVVIREELDSDEESNHYYGCPILIWSSISLVYVSGSPDYNPPCTYPFDLSVARQSMGVDGNAWSRVTLSLHFILPCFLLIQMRFW